jgi:hypothetical protein
MKKLFCAIALVVSIGCTTAHYRPYVGEQQNWPTAVGSIVNTRYDIPIFTSLPPAPYDVMGELRITSPFYAQPEENHMPVLIKKAEKIGADAIVFVEGSEYFRVPYGIRENSQSTNATDEAQSHSMTQVNRFLPESFRPGVTFLVVKWLKGPPPGLEADMAKTKDGSAAKPGSTTAKAEPVPAVQPAPAVAPVPSPAAAPVKAAPVPAMKEPAPRIQEEPAPKLAPTTNFGPKRASTED